MTRQDVMDDKTLREHVSMFSIEGFSTRRHAQSLFTDHAEGDIQGQITSMATVQTLLESRLRESVRTNYRLFVDLSKEVPAVEGELVSIKGMLIDARDRVMRVANFSDHAAAGLGSDGGGDGGGGSDRDVGNHTSSNGDDGNSSINK